MTRRTRELFVILAATVAAVPAGGHAARAADPPPKARKSGIVRFSSKGIKAPPHPDSQPDEK